MLLGSRGLGSGVRGATGATLPGTPPGAWAGTPGAQRNHEGCGSSRGEDVGAACAIPEPSASQSDAEPEERSIARH